MCGILGAHHPKLPPNIQIEVGLRKLQHRGPDDEIALSLRHQGQPYCLMGASRLSIVDPEDGMQPISDPSGRFWVAMNGEIYNHQSLRRECVSNGFTPLNGSDTAVVAALCAFLPILRVLERLRGMFALSITDTQTGDLFLVRDRMGVKPLYWAEDEAGVLFWASEPRALLTQPSIPRIANQTAISQFLLFEYIPAPLSIWKGIQKLQPGQLLHRTQRTAQLSTWWSPPRIEHPKGSSLVHWKRSLSLALRLATQLRLEADVDVGTLLSGGIDSATITAIASELHPAIQSFSLSMPLKGFDEATAAQETATALNVPLYIQSLRPDEYDAHWKDIFAHMDEPLADSSLLPTWVLMKAVREKGLKCVLSGDGADESFMGYPTYLAHYAHPLLRPTQSFIKRLAHRLPVSTAGLSAQYMLERWAGVQAADWAERHQLWMGAWLPNELRQCTHDTWDIVQQWSRQAGPDRVGRAMYLDQRLYLAEGVLTKVDRASMAHGVEVRSPFMDHHIVEMAAQLPLEARWNKGQRKAILRSLSPRLPVQTRKRPKKGFGSPIASYLQAHGKHWLSQLPEACEAWIRPELMRAVIQAHLDGKADHRRRLWTAVCLSQWAQHFNQSS